MRMLLVFPLYIVATLFFPVFCTCQEDGAKQESVSSSSPKEVVQQALAVADIRINGTRPWDIKVYNDEFYSRVLSDGSLGLGESYMDGWWETESVDECIYRILSAHLDQRFHMNWQMLWAYVKAFMTNLQDKKGSMKVIDQHYQLGNTLYANMLDATLGYSCGYWKNVATLDEAQMAKYDLICRKLGIQKGMRILDIGCGFGGFARYAAEVYGAHVTGITLSSNQAALAQEICKGLPVEIRVQDYRDVAEEYDRIIEIGMFEHVGGSNYRTFMEMVHRCLKPKGLFMLHTIGSNESTGVGDPWISKYIFPKSHLPSITQIGKSIEGLFVMEDWHNFGPDYDITLQQWFSNFNSHWPEIKDQYGERFYRMWKYYLLSCAGAFRARSIQLWEVVLSKDGVPGGYETVR